MKSVGRVSLPGNSSLYMYDINMATYVLLFFLDLLVSLQSESWISHCFMFELNLQAVTRFVTQTSRLSAALQSAARATT